MADDAASERRVEVAADEEASPELSLDPEILELVANAAEAALDAEHTAGPDSVFVMLSNSERLHELNLRFNGEDAVTDVLSFNDVEGWHNGVPPEAAEDEFAVTGDSVGLGEIVISVEQTLKQANERSIPFERELAMLTIHGVLHLLGYDHADPEEERVMFGKTDDILVRVIDA